MKLTNNNVAQTERGAIFAGSFNPFTIGHASIVERALQLFDHIYIVLGVNADKPHADVRTNAEAISLLYNKEPRVSVIIWDGLMVELARQKNVKFFVRGLRNASDFEYERAMADINRRLAGIETIFLPALPGHEAITSSVVRELKSYGADVSTFIPSF